MSSPQQGGAPIQGGRALLRGRVLGFPVYLDVSFIVIMGILGYASGLTLSRLGLWLLITPVAVLAHELGHAVLARAAGAQPEIALAGFGGVTTYTPPRPLSRGRSLGISLAGPGVGLVLGLALMAIRSRLGDSLIPGTWQFDAIRFGIWTCIGWSLLNLLPILPLDGGQAMRELLPGSPEVRTRRAAAVSVVVALLAAIGAYLVYRQPFIAIFLAVFAFNNIVLLRSAGGVRSRPAPAGPEQAIVELLWQSQPARARELLETLPPQASVDLAVHGAVQALTGQRSQGYALLDQEWQRRPGDRNVAALLVLTQALDHDWDAVIATLQGPIGPSVPAAAIDRAIAEAHGVGREDVAGRLRLITEPPTG